MSYFIVLYCICFYISIRVYGGDAIIKCKPGVNLPSARYEICVRQEWDCAWLWNVLAVAEVRIRGKREDSRTGKNDEHLDENIIPQSFAGLGGCDLDVASKIVSVRYYRIQAGKLLSQ